MTHAKAPGKIDRVSLTTGKKSPVTIRDADYKAHGGEKAVFLKGGKAYGVYHDPAGVMDAGKAKELVTLTHPGILRPTDLLFKGGTQIGEAMVGITDPWVLCQLFTRTFRERRQIDQDTIISIIKAMQEILSHAHSHDIYAVDNNENNWLVTHDLQQVKAIDVGNWETPGFPSRFIMLNIRDRKQKKPEGQDWFSHAILCGCLLIGKHPYEATIDKYKHLPKADTRNGISVRPRMEAMMDNGATFFDSKARLPKACYPLGVIPTNLRGWMEAVLMRHERIAPPGDFDAVVIIRTLAAIASGRKFDIEKVGEFHDDIVQVIRPMISRTVLTTDRLYYDGGSCALPVIGSVHLVFTTDGTPVIAWLCDGELQLWTPGTQQLVPCDTRASHLIEANGRLIAVYGEHVTQIDLTDFGDTVRPSIRPLGQVVDMPHATEVFRGCLIQNMLGSMQVSLFAEPGTCYQYRIDAIEGQKILDAKYERRVLQVVATRKGVTNRYTWFRAGSLHLVNEETDVDYNGMNWTVNSKGVMTEIVEDGMVRAAKVNLPYQPVEFTDPAITTAMNLVADGSRTLFFRGNELYRLSVKK